MDDIFRSFFGFSQRENPQARWSDDHNRPNSSTSDDDILFETNPFFSTHPDDVFRHFDQIFTNFERVFQGLGVLEPPAFEFRFDEFRPDASIMPVPPPQSPRDEMLKHPHAVVPYQREDEQSNAQRRWFDRLWSKPSSRELKLEDSDLDEAVKKDGLARLFDEQQIQQSPVLPRHSSVFHSVSVRTHRSADGKVEETRTMVDGEGNQQTIVTRTVDGQTVRQTTKKNRTGETEVTEDLINMNEGDRKNFDERWNRRMTSDGRSSGHLLPRDEALLESDHADSNRSIFKRLFGFDFPDFRVK